jgi:hypothetical protein
MRFRIGNFRIVRTASGSECVKTEELLLNVGSATQYRTAGGSDRVLALPLNCRTASGRDQDCLGTTQPKGVSSRGITRNGQDQFKLKLPFESAQSTRSLPLPVL